MKSERKTDLLGMELSRLEALFADMSLERFRARQVFHNVYGRLRTEFSSMTDLSKPLRNDLAKRFTIKLPHITRRTESCDGTIKYLLQLEDTETVESVYIPETHRTTLCLSTQVGCSFRCRFCLTASLGFKRNLTFGEIVGQVMSILSDHNGTLNSSSRLNVVFMGMGEPLLNYENVMEAIRVMAHPDGLAISPKRMTLSTAGVIPRLSDLGREKVRPHLAVSLSATTEAQRNALMPHNRKYSLESLLEACRQYPLSARERLTFEYVLLDGVNDSLDDARRLVKLLDGIRAKINLLALNEAAELPFRASPPERVHQFQEYLASKHVSVFVRKPRGLDILAACGQLKREVDPAGLENFRSRIDSVAQPA
ncbi:MAG: 23S rRNA (adenine(2503)-C(2))-methyltransferase RlmN [Acidobacteriia bacterium]|nr:23S rRNA (adenine(2503)-C(2))-methyltransferase RlmN [Terriglobia bacterium]